MTDNEAISLLANTDSILCYDLLTRRYFRTSRILLQNGMLTFGLLAANHNATLKRQAALVAAAKTLESSWEYFRKAVEAEEKRERKRLRNRKKMERMKRLRVKKVKR